MILFDLFVTLHTNQLAAIVYGNYKEERFQGTLQ